MNTAKTSNSFISTVVAGISFSRAQPVLNNGKSTIGHVNSIPTMQFFTGVSRNTQPNLICYH